MLAYITTAKCAQIAPHIIREILGPLQSEFVKVAGSDFYIIGPIG